jgi:putative endonuclease
VALFIAQRIKNYNKNMATFYVIYSRSSDNFYVGSSLDYEMQLQQHQKNHFPKGYTSDATDWTTFFAIGDIPIDTARRIEKHVKKVKSRAYFESLKSDPKIAEQLKEEFQTRSSR